MRYREPGDKVWISTIHQSSVNERDVYEPIGPVVGHVFDDEESAKEWTDNRLREFAKMAANTTDPAAIFDAEITRCTAALDEAEDIVFDDDEDANGESIGWGLLIQ